MQLLNSTLELALAARQQQVAPARLRLDCRVLGYPAPWVQWYHNGRLLRNRPNQTVIRTNRWRRRRNVRLSRLELELRPGGNESGDYECRAMSVAAREPVVGAYSLLVRPDRLRLVPVQAPAGSELPAEWAAEGRTGEPAAGGGPRSAPKPERERTQQVAPTGPPAGRELRPEEGPASSSAPASSTPAPAAKGHSESNRRPAAALVGQRCPREAHDNFCLNRGTCVLIGSIEEYFCK